MSDGTKGQDEEQSDTNVPFEDAVSSSGSSERDIYVSNHIQQAEKKRKVKAGIAVLSASDRIYMDNQNLWKKISKISAECERFEERLRYVQLDLNNKHVECDRHVAEIERLRQTHRRQRDMLARSSNDLARAVFWCTLACSVSGGYIFHDLTGVSILDTIGWGARGAFGAAHQLYSYCA